MLHPVRYFSLAVLSTFLFTALFTINIVKAEETAALKGFEFTPYIGYTFSSDISDLSGEDISLSDDINFGASLSWQDSPNGQGQVLINYVGHDFDNPVDGTTAELNILYTHFSGVALFRQQNYITTVSFGLGGAYMDSDHESGLYPSATAALGTRYELNPQFSLFTELRTYATVTDDDDEFFCKAGACFAEFGDTVYLDTTISVGLAYAF